MPLQSSSKELLVECLIMLAIDSASSGMTVAIIDFVCNNNVQPQCATVSGLFILRCHWYFNNLLVSTSCSHRLHACNWDAHLSMAAIIADEFVECRVHGLMEFFRMGHN